MWTDTLLEEPPSNVLILFRSLVPDTEKTGIIEYEYFVGFRDESTDEVFGQFNEPLPYSFYQDYEHWMVIE